MQKHMSLKQRYVHSKTLMWKDKQIYSVKWRKAMQEARASHMVGCFKNVISLRLILQQCKYFTLWGIVSDNIFFLLSSFKIKSLFVRKATQEKGGTQTHKKKKKTAHTHRVRGRERKRERGGRDIPQRKVLWPDMHLHPERHPWILVLSNERAQLTFEETG